MPDWDPKCPYSEICQCDHGLHADYPFQISMEVSNVPICLRSYDAGISDIEQRLVQRWASRRQNTFDAGGHLNMSNRTNIGTEGFARDYRKEFTLRWRLKIRVRRASNKVRRRLGT